MTLSNYPPGVSGSEPQIAGDYYDEYAEDLRERVMCGVAVLDKERPGWRARIDTHTLDLGNCYRCVLGQVFGWYYDGIKRLTVPAGCDRWAVMHGFTLDNDVTDDPEADDDTLWQLLADIWREAIE